MWKKVKKFASKQLLEAVIDEFIPAVSKAIGQLDKRAKETKNPYDDIVIAFLREVWNDVIGFIKEK